jgi:oligoribonuclease (3'-5' exoribonuclease)
MGKLSKENQNWLDNSILCWLDYETTGVDLDKHTTYPIELGYVFTDTHFNTLMIPNTTVSERSMLINWGFERFASWSDFSDDSVSAFGVHKIGIGEVQDKGVKPAEAALTMYQDATLITPPEGRCILVSDNIQFEWTLTKHIMATLPAHKWPFHYCGWDTSILSLVPGLFFEDPKNTPHRALPDVHGLLNTVRKCLVGWM